MFNLLLQRNFALLWTGQIISMIGDWVLFIALPFYVYALTGSALATGAMFIANVLPRLLLGSVAGVFVDRWDRRRVLMVADILRAFMLLFLLFVRSADWLWLVYVVALVESAISEFFLPAKNAIIPQLVGERDLMVANSLNAVSESLTRLIGPALGGMLMGLLGLTSVVLVDAVSFLVSAALIFLIRSGAPSHGEHLNAYPVTVSWASLWRDWRDGLRLIKQDRLLVALFSVTGVMMFADSIVTALLVVFVQEVMRAGTMELGWLMAAQGAGGLMGGLVVGRVSQTVKPNRLIALGGLSVGLIWLTVMNFASFQLALPLFAIAGVTVTGMIVGITTLLQGGAADRYRGRVFGTFSTTNAFMRVIGLLLAGVLGDIVSVVPVLDIAGGLWLLSGVLAVVMLRPPVAERISLSHGQAVPRTTSVQAAAG